MRGMACLDTVGNDRIQIIMELVGDLSRAETADGVLTSFARGMQRLKHSEAYMSLSTRGLGPGRYRITRMALDGDLDAMRSTRPWASPQSIDVHTGGFLGQLIRTAYPTVIHHLDLRDDPVLGDALAPFRALMAVPLFDQGEPLNWAIHLSRDPSGFDLHELEDRILQDNLVGGTVRTVLMAHELHRMNEQVHREVERIADIQRTLLPERMPEIEGIRLAAHYATFDRAGGDYYDFLPLRCREHLEPGEYHPDHPLGIMIADASGHGPAAAVIMAMLHSILHASAESPEGPAEVLRHINHHLCRKRIEGSFVTAFFGVYDPATRRFTYARAGHNPPLLKQPGVGGAVSRLDAVGGIPLGVLPDAAYEEHTQHLEHGHAVVLYTDGITEAFDAEQHMFGVEGIERALEQCTGQPDCVVSSIMTALEAHQGDVRPSDDQTLVVMRLDDET